MAESTRRSSSVSSHVSATSTITPSIDDFPPIMSTVSASPFLGSSSTPASASMTFLYAEKPDEKAGEKRRHRHSADSGKHGREKDQKPVMNVAASSTPLPSISPFLSAPSQSSSSTTTTSNPDMSHSDHSVHKFHNLKHAGALSLADLREEGEDDEKKKKGKEKEAEQRKKEEQMMMRERLLLIHESGSQTFREEGTSYAPSSSSSSKNSKGDSLDLAITEHRHKKRVKEKEKEKEGEKEGEKEKEKEKEKVREKGREKGKERERIEGHSGSRLRKRLSSEFDSPKNHNKQTRLHEKPSRANLFNNSDSRKVTALRSSVDLEEEERRSQSVNLPFSSPPLFSLPSPSITPSSYSEVFMRLRSTSAPISVVKRGGIGGSGGGGGGEDEDEEGGGKTKRWVGAPPLSGRLPSPLPHMRFMYARLVASMVKFRATVPVLLAKFGDRLNSHERAHINSILREVSTMIANPERDPPEVIIDKFLKIQNDFALFIEVALESVLVVQKLTPKGST